MVFDLRPSVISIALFVVGWGAGWFLFWRLRPLPPAAPTAARAPVAVVIPARNEERSLPTLLAGLVGQLGSDDELVVVDDRSDDRTAEVARNGGAQVVSAPEPPSGWAGKSHGCHLGAHATAAPVLVFVDADVTPAADLVDRLAAASDRAPAALVSMQPWHRTVRPYEQLSALFNITALMGSVGFTALGRRARSRLAFGPVLACRRQSYEHADGHAHASVRGAVAEDLALAARFPEVRLFTGAPGGTTFRMYPSGLRSLIQGWTKNIATGARYVRWWFNLAVIAWIWSLAGGWLTSPWFYVASAAQVLVLGRRAGRFGVLTAALYPALVVFFLVVFLRSVALTALGREVSWKGRSVPSRR